MFDYFNSTKKAKQVLVRIAETAFASEDTKKLWNAKNK